MTLNELRARVTIESMAAVAALSLLATWLWGGVAGVGVLAGGALAIGNFRWLAGRVAALGSAGDHGGHAWALGFALRFVALALACAALLASGSAHPVALLVGLTVVPCALVARGLGAALREP